MHNDTYILSVNYTIYEMTVAAPQELKDVNMCEELFVSTEPLKHLHLFNGHQDVYVKDLQIGQWMSMDSS